MGAVKSPDIDRRERAMVHGSEASSARECALSPSRLAAIDRLIDHVFWTKLMKSRVFPAGINLPPEALAEFPPEWIQAAKAGKFICPRPTGPS